MPRLDDAIWGEHAAAVTEARERLTAGEEMQAIDLPAGAYAAVRERHPDSVPPYRLRAHDVQIIGGAVLNEGMIAELKTGEGKTLVAVFATYLNALAGREWALGGDLLGLNARLTWMGGRRQSPVDEAASRAREDVVFDERRAFEQRQPVVALLDVTATYRLNRPGVSHVLALQLKNVLAAKDTYPAYSFRTDRVERVEEGFRVPVLSYEVVF